MSDLCITVASGFSVSSAFTLDRLDRSFTVQVPSMAAVSVQAQFTTVSGTTPWGTLFRYDGSGLPFTVYSATGPGFGYVRYAPTAWARLNLAANVTDTVTFTVRQVTAR